MDADSIQQAISLRLPRCDSEVAMTPSLAYGRHRGPSSAGARRAAVAVALYEGADGWTIPLTLRPTALQHHGGQVCLPGGRVERGEQVREAALREFEEELGIRPRVMVDAGWLSTQYVYASDNLVHPLVFTIEPPDRGWKPDPIEVAEVIPLPLAAIADPKCRVKLTRERSVRRAGRVVGQLSFRAAAIRHEGHEIWGATAMILEELARILHC